MVESTSSSRDIPTYKEIEEFNEAINNNKIDSLLNMIDSHPIRYFFNIKLDDENDLSIFHKIILLDQTLMFDKTVDFFYNKFKEELGINFNSKNSKNSNISKDNNSKVCFFQLEEKRTNDTEYHNDLSLIKLLSLKDKDGNTPILFAAYKGNIEIISKLIEAGVKYDIKNNAGLDVIQMAAQNDNSNVIIYFKEKYNYDIYQKDNYGNNSIHWASSNCAKSALTYLLYYIDDNNMNIINSVNNNGQTALHLTILTNESLTIIKKLIKKGINTEIKDNNGLTVYDIAKNNPKYELINKTLIDYTETNIFGFNYHINDFKNKYFKFCIFILLFSLIFYSTNALSLSYLEENVGEVLFIKYIFNFLSVIFIFDFFYIMFSDAGAITNKKSESLLELVTENKNIKRLCPFCMVDQKTYTKHCFICNKCIEVYDHHCHWINNCIGAANKKKFITFLFLLLIIIIIAYFISFYVLIMPMTDQYMLTDFIMSHKTYKNIIAGLISLITLFFFFPVAFIIYNQVQNECPPKPKKNEVKEYYKELKEINSGNNMVNQLQIKED